MTTHAGSVNEKKVFATSYCADCLIRGEYNYALVVFKGFSLCDMHFQIAAGLVESKRL